MNAEFFNNLCEVLGDQSRPKEERWKDLAYLNTCGQSVPVDVQPMIRDNKAWYVDKGTNERYFLFMDYPYPEFSCNDVAQTLTTFEISCLHSVSFVLPDDVVDIYDIIDPLLGTTHDKPVKIKMQKSKFVNPDTDYTIPIHFNRALSKDDYDLKWYNSKTNEELAEKPTKIGFYTLKVICKNGYVGEASCDIRIDRI